MAQLSAAEQAYADLTADQRMALDASPALAATFAELLADALVSTNSPFRFHGTHGGFVIEQDRMFRRAGEIVGVSASQVRAAA